MTPTKEDIDRMAKPPGDVIPPRIRELSRRMIEKELKTKGGSMRDTRDTLKWFTIVDENDEECFRVNGTFDDADTYQVKALLWIKQREQDHLKAMKADRRKGGRKKAAHESAMAVSADGSSGEQPVTATEHVEESQLLMAGVKRSRVDNVDDSTCKSGSRPPPSRHLPLAEGADPGPPASITSTPPPGISAAAAAVSSSAAVSTKDPGPLPPSNDATPVTVERPATRTSLGRTHVAAEKAASPAAPLSQGAGWHAHDAGMLSVLADIGIPGCSKVSVPTTNCGLAATTKCGLAVARKQGGEELQPPFDHTTTRLFKNLAPNQAVRGVLVVNEPEFMKLKSSFEKNESWVKTAQEVEEVFYFSSKNRSGQQVVVHYLSKRTSATGCEQPSRRVVRPLGGPQSLRGVASNGRFVAFQRVQELGKAAADEAIAGFDAEWYDRVDVRRFHYRSTHSSFWFRLEATTKRGKTKRQARSQGRFRVVVETECSERATEHPVHAGGSLVAKMVDLIQTLTGGERPSLKIEEWLSSR